MAVSLTHPDVFSKRHIGPDEEEQLAMLEALGLRSLEELVDSTVPKSIRMGRPLEMPPVLTESQLLEKARELSARNRVIRSFIGTGYSDCLTPPVILRNILENPGWYTAYTPYQAEIAQGRLEALLNYQTMVEDLTGLPIANASLLDEGTAAAEAMTMLRHIHGKDGKTFFASEGCHPQTIDVVRTRAKPLGIEIVVGDHRTFDFAKTPVFGVLVQYPATDGPVHDYRAFIQAAHAAGALVAMAADLLALAVLVPPGELGADVALGSSQRFGVPLGYGGPHAAYFAAKQEHVRSMPGRIIGVSQDANGHAALRMALGTREQHIRREKATSNICTAQVLLAVIAGSYAVYHGPKGIRAIAERVQALTGLLAEGLKRSGFKPAYDSWFDTVRVDTSPEEARRILAAADTKQLGFRRIGERAVGISLDETHGVTDVDDVLSCFREGRTADPSNAKTGSGTPKGLERTSAFLTHSVFNKHHSETEMLRYLRLLESRDLSLTHSMIPLGSCTMKLNATAEMMPVTMPGFGKLHPFAPRAQAEGYKAIFDELEKTLAEITGFPGISLQPNAGSQGEYAGLLVIRKYQETRGQGHRSVCLIPESAHGTNPASAAMAGMKVVVVKCDDNGNIDVGDLETKASLHAKDLCALMVTYPSTHGVFEEDIKKACSIVHEFGGQVYMDGANMNALVGLARPGDMGADVCHVNAHKTLCIPHGGGGPGMGPIGVAAHLSKFLPKHPVVAGVGGDDGIGAISAAPWGSASILLISWAYIRMMGGQGLTDATRIAILNANYIAKRLDPHFPVLYKGKKGFVAHECIIDLRPLKKTSGVEAEDVAKRLMDYGFHAPTLSFPVAGTLMIEPTESETKEEIDRFCDAMIAIRAEIRDVEEGKQPREGNVLKNAPHTAAVVIADAWTRPYSRERAAFPAPWVRSRKFWPSVGRVNNAFGDRNLVCSCPPIEDYAEPKRAAG